MLLGIVLEGDQRHLAAKELGELGLVDLPAQRLVQALVVHENELQTHCANELHTVTSSFFFFSFLFSLQLQGRPGAHLVPGVGVDERVDHRLPHLHEDVGHIDHQRLAEPLRVVVLTE